MYRTIPVGNNWLWEPWALSSDRPKAQGTAEEGRGGQRRAPVGKEDFTFSGPGVLLMAAAELPLFLLSCRFLPEVSSRGGANCIR